MKGLGRCLLSELQPVSGAFVKLFGGEDEDGVAVGLAHNPKHGPDPVHISTLQVAHGRHGVVAHTLAVKDGHLRTDHTPGSSASAVSWEAPSRPGT